MAFKNYNDFPAPKPIRIPIGEKIYSFPGTISGRAWMLIEKMASYLDQAKLAELRGEKYDPEMEALDDLEYADINAEVFGDTKQELVADGVTSDCLKRLFYTLITYHMHGKEAAERMWNQGEAIAPNRAQRRAKTSPGSRGSQGGSTRPQTAQAGARSSSTGHSSRQTSKSTTPST